MATQFQSSCTAENTVRFVRPAGRLAWLLASLALAACGGSSSSGPSAGPPTPPPTGTPTTPSAQSKGTVVIHVTTTAGDPVAGVGVALNGGFNGRSATTDANGDALFADVPAGEASTNLWGAGYHPAARRLSVVADAVTTVPVEVESLTEAIPVLLAARATPAPDGSSMSLELDIAVLDEQGVGRETLTATDFGLYGVCDWYPCLSNEDGSATNSGYSARVDGASLVPVPATARPALATAVLLDQSERMAEFDPAGLRVSGLASFLQSVTSPDSIALGSYYDSAAAGDVSTPQFTTYGAFTSDTANLQAMAASLPGSEIGGNTVEATASAIAQMVEFTSSNTAGALDGTRRSVVVVDTQPDNAGFIQTCGSGCLSAVQAARDAGISVIAIGQESSQAFALGARTQGAGVYVVSPEQLPPVFHGLDSIMSGAVAYNRVQLVLEAAPGLLQPGRLVSGYLGIRVGPDTTILWWITVPI